MDIAAAFTALDYARKALTTINNTIRDNTTRTQINEVLTELGTALNTMYDVRNENFSLQEENAQLKREATDRNEWKERLAQYELEVATGGATVY